MGKQLPAKFLIAKLNKYTESEVIEWTGSTVDETALAIRNWQGSHGITIVISQRKIIFHIQVDPYWPQWQTYRSKLADKDIEIYEFHQDSWNLYLMLRFDSAHIPWNTISDLEARRWSKALHDDLVLPLATARSDIRPREYALTVDAIKKQLPSRGNVSLPSDWWTSPNTLAITSVFAYSIDRNWATCGDEISFDEVHRMRSSPFES